MFWVRLDKVALQLIEDSLDRAGEVVEGEAGPWEKNMEIPRMPSLWRKAELIPVIAVL